METAWGGILNTLGDEDEGDLDQESFAIAAGHDEGSISRARRAIGMIFPRMILC